ncbi:MAG: calcineurin-like phosphoesterase family protein [Bacteroidales bacterium]|nr:calcineurin-like phosphoesterase family protein [Bacteroidales bacterium]
MRKKFYPLPALFLLSLFVAGSNSLLCGQGEKVVTGVVFHDRDADGLFDKSKDKALKDVAVSNGREIVITDRQGKYELPLKDNIAIFVIKPRNWMVPVDEKQIPGFYYLYSPGGATGTKYKGLEPTGSLPASVDFPLYPAEEPDKIDVLVFGDTQTRDEKEVFYTARDVLQELIGADYAFGVTLGDVAYDNLNIYEHLTTTLSSVGIPMWYVAGNHDNDYTGNNITEARGTWFRTFGPRYYSFSQGPAHFIVLDDISWIVESDTRYYRTGLGEDQMEFLRNELQRLDKDQLVFVLSHIPYEGSTAWQDEEEKRAFYELLAGHPNTVSMAAHTHRHYHHFIDAAQGWPGNSPHHMVSVGTACGAWWTGAPDEFGIPHAMMSDGTPNCYTILHIDGTDWKLEWRTPGKPADYQMHIEAPDMITSATPGNIDVLANIYNALPSAQVKVRIGEKSDWTEMKRVVQNDPVRVAITAREKELGKVPWRNLGNPAPSEHIWQASFDLNLKPGIYVIEVEATDKWWKYDGKRLLYVK